ncbi:unnamed protein product [Clonostachys chloroleuca]|uniref:Uncharacterized protein n=1 Tax=Clonostachys chloroleuca TaxID=1926264 RepID=A0AA35Q562_9HYPO|nr:unnamed protein product [Clonostachys chloroleuca]
MAFVGFHDQTENLAQRSKGPSLLDSMAYGNLFGQFRQALGAWAVSEALIVKHTNISPDIARNYTNRSHEIFTIQMLGKKLYIVTAPEDVAAVYKNTVSLGFDGHLNDLLVSFGFGEEALRKAWHTPTPGDHNYIPNNPINPDQVNFIHHTEETFKKQLLPGPRMDTIGSVFLEALHQSVQFDHLGFCTSAPPQAPCKHISLYDLCRFTMVDAATRSLFGSHLHDINHCVVNHMLGFNDYAWQVFFRLPRFLGLGVSEPQRHLMDTLRQFVQLPQEKRAHATWAIQTVLQSSEHVGIDLESRTSVLLMMFWAANSNEYNIAFWVIAHLLYDEALKDLVIQETEAAWQSGALDIKYLFSHCPNLEAIFNEALRLNGGAMVSRIVLEKTIIGGKELQPGNAIIMPSRQLHTNEKVWGSNPREFNPSRFLKHKTMTRHSSFRPFGGGITYCPGRVLAKHQVYGLIALLFHRFEMSLVKGEDGKKPEFPVLNDTTPGLGITGPLKGMDVKVEVRER